MLCKNRHTNTKDIEPVLGPVVLYLGLDSWFTYDPVNNVVREQTWQQQFKCILLSLQAAIAAISHQVFASI